MEWLIAAEGDSGSGGLLPQMMFIAGVLILMWLLIRSWMVRRGGGGGIPSGDRSGRDERAERDEDHSRARALRRELDQVQVEMEETARQVLARLETRMARLEALIRDADDRLARLGDDGAAAADRAEPAPAPPEPPAEPPAPADDDRHADVHRLAADGLTPVEIAERTGRGIGEVELILGLKR